MIKEFIIKNLLSIHSGGVGGKIWASVQLAAVPAVGLSLSEKLKGWYIESQLFIILLFAALFIDLFVGVWKHLKLNSFSPKKLMLGFGLKLGAIVFVYFITEAAIQILSDADLDSVYFKVATRLMLFFYPAGNVIVNMGIITNGKFPPLGFLTKFEKFNKTLDVNVFKQKEDESKDTDHNPVE